MVFVRTPRWQTLAGVVGYKTLRPRTKSVTRAFFIYSFLYLT